MYKRAILFTLSRRLTERRRFIQVLLGPRQTGKTTIARQLMEELSFPSHYASADEPVLKDRFWIQEQWETARFRLKGDRRRKGVLILDEIQKLPGWSESVKALWDEDTRKRTQLQVVLLGSSTLLMQKGLSESLAGRFEVIPISHWSFAEMRAAFKWRVEQYIYFGGYPGAAGLINDRPRWARYIIDSLVETCVSRDVLLLTRVDKPALLRRLFELACSYSGQILSYQKMLGQLQDAGNTVTLAHYLDLLDSAGLVRGLPKYHGREVRQRASSPKLIVLNTALMSAFSHRSFSEAREDSAFWGRLVESAVGASLANAILGKDIRLFYWLSRNREVDFVLAHGQNLTAIEVKSSLRRERLPGMAAFGNEFHVKRKLLVGREGISLKEFFLTPVEAWVE